MSTHIHVIIILVFSSSTNKYITTGNKREKNILQHTKIKKKAFLIPQVHLMDSGIIYI